MLRLCFIYANYFLKNSNSNFLFAGTIMDLSEQEDLNDRESFEDYQLLQGVVSSDNCNQNVKSYWNSEQSSEDHAYYISALKEDKHSACDPPETHRPQHVSSNPDDESVDESNLTEKPSTNWQDNCTSNVSLYHLFNWIHLPNLCITSCSEVVDNPCVWKCVTPTAIHCIDSKGRRGACGLQLLQLEQKQYFEPAHNHQWIALQGEWPSKSDS